MGERDFEGWLRSELSARGWNQAELSRRSGLSEGQISRLLSGSKNRKIKRDPGMDSIRAIARALELPEEVVYQAATGRIELVETASRRRALIEFLSEQMSAQEYDEFLDYISFRLSKQKKR